MSSYGKPLGEFTFCLISCRILQKNVFLFGQYVRWASKQDIYNNSQRPT